MKRFFSLGGIALAGAVMVGQGALGAQGAPGAQGAQGAPGGAPGMPGGMRQGGPGGPGGGGGGRGGGMNMGSVEAIQKVAENLYMIPGAGGNTSVWVTSKGLLLVDVKLPGNGQAILDQIKTVTDKPVLYIVNTHSHGDHTGGNVFFPDAVEIVAHENLAAQLLAGASRNGGPTPEQKRGLVDKTYKDKLTLFSGDESVDLYNFGPAHTNGDSLVVFRKARAMATGDVFPSKGQPLIDTNSGGSSLNYGEFVGKAAAAIKNVDIIVPGHSPLLKWQDFVDFGEFNRLMLAHAQASLKAGKTVDQAKADFVIPAKFAGYTIGATMLQRDPNGNFKTMYDQLQPKP